MRVNTLFMVLVSNARVILVKDEKLTQIMFYSLQKDPNLASFDEWKAAGNFAKDMRFFPHALSCYQRARELKQNDEDTLRKIDDLIDRITNVLEFVPGKIKSRIEDIRLSNPLDPAKWLVITNKLLKELSTSLTDATVNESDLDAAKYALAFTAYCSLRSGNEAGPVNELLVDMLDPVNLSSWTSKKIDLPTLNEKKASDPIKVVALGDNITLALQPDWEMRFEESYPFLWAKESDHGISLANNSISGAGVMDMALYLGRDVIHYKPDLVTLMYGNNDAWLGKEILPAYEALLEINVKRLIQEGIEVAIISPIPHIPSACPIDQRPNNVNLDEVKIDAYAQACKKVAARLDCIYVDVVSKFPGDETARKNYFVNGFNQPNLAGQNLIKEALMEQTIV